MEHEALAILSITFNHLIVKTNLILSFQFISFHLVDNVLAALISTSESSNKQNYPSSPCSTAASRVACSCRSLIRGR